MNDLAMLLRAVCADPADDTVRLAWADAVQEAGDDARAEFVRVQVELARATVGLQWSERYERWRDPVKGEYVAMVGALADTPRLRARSEELLDANGLRWLPAPLMAIESESASLACRYSRGFVSSLTATAEALLQHADALLWHEGQTESCGGGLIRPQGGVSHYGCRACNGTGVVPRPCPPTAQPVTRVTLTTIPFDSARMRELATKHKHDWLPTEIDGNFTTTRRFLKDVLEAEYPGVEIVVSYLVEGDAATLTSHTFAAGIRVPDELLNPHGAPTQASERAADLAEVWMHAERAAAERYPYTLPHTTLVRRAVPEPAHEAYSFMCDCLDPSKPPAEQLIPSFTMVRRERIRTGRGNFYATHDGQCPQCRRVFVSVAPVEPPSVEVPREGWRVARPAQPFHTFDPFMSRPLSPLMADTPRLRLSIRFTPPGENGFHLTAVAGDVLRDVRGTDSAGNSYHFAEIVLTNTRIGGHMWRHGEIEIEAESVGAFTVEAPS